jgi:vanillate O-demethylase monooxygenase subunit
MTYLFRSWYATGFAHELNRENLLARKVLGRPLVLFRLESGDVTALDDRCPHRFAPLSKGHRVGDAVECGYHGLRFNAAGRCVANPHGDGAIPRAAVVRHYPTVERNGILWTWMGEPERADLAALPDLAFLGDIGEAAVSTGYMWTGSHYELLTDNLLDLGHADFIHREAFNTGGNLCKVRANVTDRDGGVHARWDFDAHPAQPFFDPFLPQPGAPARQCLDVQWLPPSSIMLEARAWQPDVPSAEPLSIRTVHLLTPESETSTHYFFAGRRNFVTDDRHLAEQLTAGAMHAFIAEDKPMVEAVQQRMGTTDLWSLSPVLLPCDAGAVRARRLLKQRIEVAASQA